MKAKHILILFLSGLVLIALGAGIAVAEWSSLTPIHSDTELKAHITYDSTVVEVTTTKPDLPLYFQNLGYYSHEFVVDDALGDVIRLERNAPADWGTFTATIDPRAEGEMIRLANTHHGDTDWRIFQSLMRLIKDGYLPIGDFKIRTVTITLSQANYDRYLNSTAQTPNVSPEYYEYNVENVDGEYEHHIIEGDQIIHVDPSGQ